MMPAVLFFVAAVRGGDLAQWLGDKTIDILRKADGKALNKLLSEGELMGRVASERSSGDWRSLPVPFYHNDEFQKILLHVKDEAYEQTEDSKGHKNVRFLFELTLDKIGDLQLDGFFHSGGRLDLIVRTHERFSQAMQQEMRRLYAGAVEQAGVHGELAFQTSLKQWVMIDYKEKGAAV